MLKRFLRNFFKLLILHKDYIKKEKSVKRNYIGVIAFSVKKVSRETYTSLIKILFYLQICFFILK